MNAPTDWVSNVVIATKPSGDLRICIDPKELNKALKRERYPIPVIEHVLPELTKARVFTKVDARNGYWHVVLDEESAKLTTFDTPFGRYYWKRLPFGLSVSSEIFQKRIHQALDGLSGLLDVHDDMVIYGVGDTDVQADADHDRNLEKFLQRCREKGIKLNKQKLKLKCTEFPYLGHLVTKEGLKPDPDKIEAVQEMPKPDSVKAVRRFCGFVNYLAKFMPKLSEVMEPIRNLTGKENEWKWTHEHDAAFKRIKEMATTSPLLRYYNPEDELTIQCDASEKGLGAAVLQKGQPVAFASRALTDTETRYAQIEKELLAVVFALDKFEQYAYGRPVTIESDHKPLEAIAKKPLRCAPKRLQGMFLKIQKFDINIVYNPGSRMYLADTLSRAYLPSSKNTQGDFEMVNVLKILPVSEEKHDEILRHTSKDEVLQLLKEVILTGWPTDKKSLPAVLNPYYSYRDELSVYDGLIFRGERLVIPPLPPCYVLWLASLLRNSSYTRSNFIYEFSDARPARVRCLITLRNIRHKHIFTVLLILWLLSCFIQEAFYTTTTSRSARLIKFGFLDNNVPNWLWNYGFSTTFLVSLLKLRSASQLGILVLLFS